MIDKDAVWIGRVDRRARLDRGVSKEDAAKLLFLTFDVVGGASGEGCRPGDPH
jgi:hypothetical protein